jgi:hypothetical protein
LSSCLLPRNVKVKIYKTIILPVVLYGCKTWSSILREEHRLRRVFEIFRPKRDEVTVKWRKFYSKDLHILCLFPDIISQMKSRIIRWAGHVARMGEDRKVYKVLVGRYE